MGPWGGFITGVGGEHRVRAHRPPWSCTSSARTSARSSRPRPRSAVFWILGYATFVAANLFGVELHSASPMFVTLGALACLVFFYLNALPEIEFGRWRDERRRRRRRRARRSLPERRRPWFPGKASTACSPPCPSRVAVPRHRAAPARRRGVADPRRDMPTGILLGIFTLMPERLRRAHAQRQQSPPARGACAPAASPARRPSGPCSAPTCEDLALSRSWAWSEPSTPSSSLRPPDLLALARRLLPALRPFRDARPHETPRRAHPGSVVGLARSCSSSGYATARAAAPSFGPRSSHGGVRHA